LSSSWSSSWSSSLSSSSSLSLWWPEAESSSWSSSARLEASARLEICPSKLEPHLPSSRRARVTMTSESASSRLETRFDAWSPDVAFSRFGNALTHEVLSRCLRVRSRLSSRVETPRSRYQSACRTDKSRILSKETRSSRNLAQMTKRSSGRESSLDLSDLLSRTDRTPSHRSGRQER
jgi:hypothetical protein